MTTPTTHYTIVAPGTIHSSREYNVAVAVYHIQEPVTLKIGIEGAHLNPQTVRFTENEIKELKFRVPSLKDGDYRLKAEGVAGLEFTDSTKLNLEFFKPYVEIQTDKGRYKPGDSVNFRIIFLDENLRPAAAQHDVVIWFEDSNRNRMKELRKIRANRGVYTGKFEISELATLGTWSLVVQYGNSYTKESVCFDVEKYVLPKFSVKVETTDKVSVRDGDVQVVVRATYTYGKPVNGKVLLIFELEESQTEGKVHPGHTLLRKADMIYGMAKVDLNLKFLADYMADNTSTRQVQITATVEENFTDIRISKTTSLHLYPYRYEMSCVDITLCHQFQPNEEMEVEFKITYVDGSLLSHMKLGVRAIYTEGIRHSWSSRTDIKKLKLPEIEKKTLRYESQLNQFGIVRFNVKLPDLPDIENFTRYYTIELEFGDERRELYSTYPYREPEKAEKKKREKDYFKAELQRPEDTWALETGTEYLVTLRSCRSLTYFIYHIIGRGNILYTERVELPEPLNEYNIRFTPTFLTSPQGSIYIYYVDDKGKFHYTEENFFVIVELQNEIEISAPEEVKPGADVTLEIKTEPNSFVGLLAIDQSVLLLGNNNDLEKHSFSWLLGLYTTSTPWQGGYSHYPGQHCGVVTLTNANFFYDRKEPPMDDFQFYAEDPTHGVGNMRSSRGRAIDDIDSAQAHEVSGQAKPAVRKNFVETWIFDDIISTHSEVSEFVKTIPDTITNWVLSAFALHPEKGLAVTNEKTNIRTFQPFFVSLNLPYSVKRGEIINVPALVFNYLLKDLTVAVTLDNTDDEFDFIDEMNEVMSLKSRKQSLGVMANEAAAVSFLLRPKILGHILLKFSAISPNDDGDEMHKSLKVVPEGVTKYNNRAFFINLRDANNFNFKQIFDLELPEDYIKDSQQVEFAVMGDLLGPAINNLEQLLRLPSGCGEQTMSKMVPNFLIYNHLQSIRKLNPVLESRIKRNLEQGYHNMLHYRHGDGSFSCFGPGKDEDKPSIGSTWLTAYVLRWLSQISASELAHIDKPMLEKGYKFLLKKQATNGSFTEAGEYFNESQKSMLSLTANALLALLEQKQPKQAAIDKAIAYLSSQLEQSKELLPKAIATYALQMAKAADAPKHAANLQALAHRELDRIWWTESEEEESDKQRWWSRVWSHDVEITAYAVLTLLETEEPDSQLNAIRWLVAQRNSHGGFASSQDTVVGLRALTKFAEKAGYEVAVWDVTVSNYALPKKIENIEGNLKLETFKLTEISGIVLQSVEFPQGTKTLHLSAKGKGAAMIQISYQYNIFEEEPKPSFKIQTVLKPDAALAKLKLEVCVEYVEESKSQVSNMAILEVNLPSGYTADEQSYQDILSIERVRLVETKNSESVVVVYFESLAKGQKKCIPIEAYKTFEVTNQKPTSVILYDYYDTNKKATIYYKLEPKDDECQALCGMQNSMQFS